MKVFIKTFGCQANLADSEVLAGILVENKFKLVDSVKKADIVIVNSCGVKNTTQNRVFSFVESIPKNKKIYIGGCLPRMINLEKYVRFNGLFDTNSITNIIDLIKGKRSLYFSDKKEERILCKRVRKEVGIVVIAQGCLGSCSYCGTKLARGNLKSYPISKIKKEVERFVKGGCKMIYLSSQDNGCYGLDIKTNLVNLLKEVVKVKGDYKIRVGMINPEYTLEFLKDLIEVYKNDKIMKFLHVPVQSGSNKVLKDMNRKYKVKDFKKVVKSFRREIPDISISTDIIVGYPTEIEKDFKETVRLLKEIKPEVLNLSKFGVRPRTKASKLKQLPSQVIKERSVKLTKIYKKK